MLFREVANGSEPAFRKLYDQYHGQVYGFAKFVTHSEMLAQDITQDIFVKIWNHRAELTQVENFQGWLKVIVRNHTYNILRGMARERITLQTFGEFAPKESADIPDTTMLDREYAKLLQQAIEALPAQQKKIYLLTRQQGLKYEEVARETGLSVNTVKFHMKAALKFIRQQLQDHTLMGLAIAAAIFFPD